MPLTHWTRERGPLARGRPGLVFRRTMAAVTGAAAGAIGALLLGGSATTALPMVLFAIGGAGALALRVRETAFERTQRALDDLEARLERVRDLEARDVLLRQYATLLATTDTPTSALSTTASEESVHAPISHVLPR